MDKVQAFPLSPEQISARKKKGLKVNDRFTDLIRMKPSCLEKIYDQNTPTKLNLEIGNSGKPNMLFSYMGM